MPRLAVLASGNGTNFEALATAVRETEHECVLLICDRKRAGAFERARRLGVPSRYVTYVGRTREEAEAEIEELLQGCRADLVALAGFMRLLSPSFVRARPGRVLNIHPALLPAYPGVDSIRRAWDAGDQTFGVTVHYVDEGMDSGPILRQGTLDRRPGESLEELEARVHELEHALYRDTALRVLDEIAREAKRNGRDE